MVASLSNSTGHYQKQIEMGHKCVLASGHVLEKDKDKAVNFDLTYSHVIDTLAPELFNTTSVFLIQINFGPGGYTESHFDAMAAYASKLVFLDPTTGDEIAEKGQLGKTENGPVVYVVLVTMGTDLSEPIKTKLNTDSNIFVSSWGETVNIWLKTIQELDLLNNTFTNIFSSGGLPTFTGVRTASPCLVELESEFGKWLLHEELVKYPYNVEDIHNNIFLWSVFDTILFSSCGLHNATDDQDAFTRLTTHPGDLHIPDGVTMSMTSADEEGFKVKKLYKIEANQVGGKNFWKHFL